MALKRGNCAKEDAKAFRAELKRAAAAAAGSGQAYIWDPKYVKKGKVASNETLGGPVSSYAPKAYGPSSYVPSAYPESIPAPTVFDEVYGRRTRPLYYPHCRRCRLIGDWCGNHN